MADVPAAPAVADAEDAAEISHAPAWVPTILLHIFYPDSRKVGFGWALFLLASWATFFAHKADGTARLDASTWLLCVSMASLLIGGGTVLDAKNELEKAKLAAAPAAAQ